ncbi:hypothetical protein BKA66DRAFT_442787 [Pyrenochaeta sp. MPI-SDFR-AT-0127]|nr:hypothetical protein BKA66DRAFT_442787 [Pyrenochaeta sp. MPI-SDFR-AT-0127]
MATEIPRRGAEVIACAYVMFGIATFVVALRLYVRLRMIHIFGQEDIMITVALVFSLLQSIFMHRQVTHGGLGLKFSTLSPQQIVDFSKTAYLTIIFYNISLCATKFSILFLCIRIFNVYRWRKICYGIIGLLGLYTLWVSLFSIMPCYPIHSQWDPTVKGWCFPRVEMWLLNAALNVTTDFLIVLLPIPALVALQLPKKQKIGVTLIFALGFFICIVSILRIPSLIKASKSTDPTNDNSGIANWSIIEVNAAIVGGCLPTLKPIIGRIFPKFLSTLQTGSHSYFEHSRGANRTATNTHAGNTGSRTTPGMTPDYSNPLADEDDVPLRKMEGKVANVHVEITDDTRSEVTTERSMDRWRKDDV